jgi:G3E family GTPase
MMPFPSQQIAQQIRDLPPEKRIIFVHPNFKAQHLILKEILDQALYVRVTGQNLDRTQLQNQLDAEAERQSDEHQDGNIRYVILDEGDRVQPKALIQFFSDFFRESNHERIVRAPASFRSMDGSCSQITHRRQGKPFWKFGLSAMGECI